jgi:hypothetical protein
VRWFVRVVAALVAGPLGACGRIDFRDVAVDAAPDDVLVDAAPDGGGTNDCLAHWIDGSVSFSHLEEIMGLATASDDRDPQISTDGLRLYFDRDPGPHGGSDLFLATRASLAVDFTTASAIDNLDTSSDEVRAALNGNETLLVLSRNTVPNFQLVVSTRSDAAAPFPTPGAADQQLVVNVNTMPTADYSDPFLSADGLRLYVSAKVSGAAQGIRLATRAAGGNFEPAAVIPMINSVNGDADPALSLDERILVFSSQRPAGPGAGGSNLWYATRRNATDSFTTPRPIPDLNGDAEDSDPVLSGDSCTLYFTSTRDVDGKYHLFRAQVTR